MNNTTKTSLVTSMIDRAVRSPLKTIAVGTIAMTTVASLTFGFCAYSTAMQWKDKCIELQSKYRELAEKCVKLGKDVKKAKYDYKDVDNFSNPKWASKDFVRINAESISTRDKRYGVSNKPVEKTPEIILGKRNSKDDLRKNVEAVYKRLPHIKSTPESIALVVETVITETDGGRAHNDVPGNYGIGQFRLDTARDMLSFLKAKHPDVHAAIMKMYNGKLSMKDNLKSNIQFSIAMVVTHYWVRMGGNFYDKIGTLRGRAIAWKSTYNTCKGVGTVNAYIKRVKGYNV